MNATQEEVESTGVFARPRLTTDVSNMLAESTYIFGSFPMARTASKSAYACGVIANEAEPLKVRYSLLVDIQRHIFYSLRRVLFVNAFICRNWESRKYLQMNWL